MHYKRGPQKREKKQMSSKGLFRIIYEAFRNIKAVPGRCRKPGDSNQSCEALGCNRCEPDADHESAKPRGAPRRWSITDHLLAACALFEFKFPSLLQLATSHHTCRRNLRKLFHLDSVPSDTHMREELDKINPDELEVGFKAVMNAAQRNGVLASMQFYQGSYLLSFDGTDMFHSDRIHCDNCCKKKHADGSITYYHKLMAGAIVCPGIKTVLPVFPEAILKQDGKTKNDCEQVAAVRMLDRLKRMHPNLHFTVTADAIQSTGPQIRHLQSLGYDYILKVQPGSHKTLYREARELFELQEEQEKIAERQAAHKASRGSGKAPGKSTGGADDAECASKNPIGSISYRKNGELLEVRWINNISLNGTPDAPMVNYIEYKKSVDDQDPKAVAKAAKAEAREKKKAAEWKKLKAEEGEPDAEPTKSETQQKVNITAAVTSWEITQENAQRIIEGLRSEWKIENETFNTLKNQGYQFEHNFGHGYLYLQNVLAVLMMLTFLVDQLVAATCALYQAALAKVGRFKVLWERARTLLMEFEIPDWQTLWAYLASDNKQSLEGHLDSS
jgi:hypothetical protein